MGLFGIGASANNSVQYKLNPDNPNYQYGGAEGQVWIPQPTSEDPNAGYWRSGAEARADQYNDLGKWAANRNIYDVDYNDANGDYARQQQARADQMALGKQYQDVINGTAGPSLAELQMRQGQDNTAQTALNMAASARGGGGLLAQQQAQNANVLGQSNVNQQAAMLRAQETAQARDAYGNLINNVRGADLGSMGQRAQMAQSQAENYREQERQRDAMAMGYRQQADNIRTGQRDTNFELGKSNQSMYTALATGQQQANTARQNAIVGAAGNLAGGALGAVFGSGSGGKK